MNMDPGMGGSSSLEGPLMPDGVDFSNQTQAADFLEALLDDDELKITDNAYARYFWYGIATAIGICAVFNFLHYMTLRSRLRAAAQKKDHPARPQNSLMRWVATFTAMARESTYLQFTPTRRLFWFRVPPVGTIALIVAHFVFVVVLEFTNNDVAGAQFWQARGVRAGWLAVAQMPLLILLVNKNNLITMLTGISYERLNVLHRWTARIMLFLAILHFGYQSYGWQKYGLMKLEWSTDDCPITGIAAFALLLWLNLSTLASFRHWSYEFFVIQHILTFFGFIIAVMYHLPSTALWSRIYIYIPIALYVLDRIARTALFAFFNTPARKATLSPLEGDVTKVRLVKPSIKSWSPGAFVLLSIPKFGWVEAHPATIVSTPRSHDGDMVFMLKCQKGFTKRIMNGANNSKTALLPHTKQESEAGRNAEVGTYHAVINGPYGGSHSDFAAYDSVLLMAGSTGVTFTLALLQNLADRAALDGKILPVRRVHFMWCVKDSNWAGWCNQELFSAFERLRNAGIELEISIYVTCADAFTEQNGDPKECGCACDKSLGPCCCVLVDEDDEGIQDEEDAITPVEGSEIGKSEKTEPSKSAAIVESFEVNKPTATRLRILRCAKFYSGRPETKRLLTELLDGANGESAVGVCGPIGMSTSVRNTLVRLSDERAIHKGTGAQGCYLHVESFS